MFLRANMDLKKIYQLNLKKFVLDEVRGVTPLVEIAAQAVACNIPFEEVEHFYPPIPEQLQLRIAFWSFPESEEDIR